jgi:hypothetical protein
MVKKLSAPVVLPHELRLHPTPENSAVEPYARSAERELYNEPGEDKDT